jgi:hypothetical protein
MDAEDAIAAAAGGGRLVGFDVEAAEAGVERVDADWSSVEGCANVCAGEDIEAIDEATDAPIELALRGVDVDRRDGVEAVETDDVSKSDNFNAVATTSASTWRLGWCI